MNFDEELIINKDDDNEDDGRLLRVSKVHGRLREDVETLIFFP